MMNVLLIGAGYFVAYYLHKQRMRRLAYFAVGNQDTRAAWHEMQVEENSARIGIPLYDCDPHCIHDVEALISGVQCRKCGGWFCY